MGINTLQFFPTGNFKQKYFISYRSEGTVKDPSTSPRNPVLNGPECVGARIMLSSGKAGNRATKREGWESRY